MSYHPEKINQPTVVVKKTYCITDIVVLLSMYPLLNDLSHSIPLIAKIKESR